MDIKSTLAVNIKADPILKEFEARLLTALNFAYEREIPSAMIMSMLDVHSLHVKLRVLARTNS
jgi:hypothetical protein